MTMDRKTRTLFMLSFVLLTAVAFGYAYVWYYSAQLIRTQITALYDDAAKVGMRIEGDFPAVSGFPGPHVVRFSGRLIEGTQILNLPELRIRGLFLPGYNITISLPKGASLEGAVDPAIFSINNLDIRAAVPLQIPASLNAEDLAVWQRNGGAINISRFHMQKESLALDGTGSLALDAQLQPTGLASVHISGYIAFLEWLKSKGVLKDKQSMFAGMILTGLSRTDAKTGETYVQTDLNLKDRRLYVGPLAVLTLPTVSWASKTASHLPPAPPQ